MDSLTTSHLPQNRHLPENTADAVTLGLDWAALSDASAIVAQLAGAPPEPSPMLAPQFAARIWESAPWQAELAQKHIADLRAVMEPGIATLLTICERGGNCRAAAQSLWHEFIQARQALLSLLPASHDNHD